MVTTAMTVLPCEPRGCSTHDHSGDGRAALGDVPGFFFWVLPRGSARLRTRTGAGDRLGAGADGAWCLRRTATRSPWRTVMTGTATVSPGGTSRDARVQAREVSIRGPSPADAGAIRRMLRRRGYHRTGPAAEGESAVFGVVPVTTGRFLEGLSTGPTTPPGAEGRSARTLRACTHSNSDEAHATEILTHRPLLPTSRPAVSPRWQRRWSPAAHWPRCPVHHRLGV